MRENLMKKALRAGKVVIGGGISQLKGCAIPQLYATAGFQFVWIDMQHSPYTIENINDLVVGARAAGIDNFVRVPSLDPPLISRLLDAGAQGVMIPLIKTPDEVFRVVNAVKYPREGKRSIATKRIHTDFQNVDAREMVKDSNEQTLIVIQIETKEALENVREISKVPGVDILWIGPSDLSESLGYLGQKDHPEVISAIEKIIDATIEAKITTGLTIPFDLKNAEKWVKKGVRAICYSNDIDLILGGASRGIEKIRALLKS